MQAAESWEAQINNATLLATQRFAAKMLLPSDLPDFPEGGWHRTAAGRPKCFSPLICFPVERVDSPFAA